MTIRINNIKIALDEDVSKLKNICSKKMRLKTEDIIDFRITKESVDARRKDRIDFIYTVEFSLHGKEKSMVDRLNDKNISYIDPEKTPQIVFGNQRINSSPVIIGMGPAGLFAGLVLSQNGYKPVIIERGKNVDERTEAVHRFWKTGDFDPECNVQFGEGGAGTFSDGKLTTRIRDPRIRAVLDELVKGGAPENIVYSNKPHIGTDILKKVVACIREKIIELGGKVYFSSKVTDINIEAGALKGITVNDNLNMDCEALILAIGHSARDTYHMLYKNNVYMTPKPLAVGFRVEHKQRMIDERQYGKFAEHPKLRAADYRLAYHSSKYDRGCYTFCMCPGGIVVAAASEEGMVVTNGMSEFARDKENANSAIVCNVMPRDFPGDSPLSGIEFQRSLERLAFRMGGGDYMAPVQRIDDFLKGKATSKLGSATPSYTRGYNFNDLNSILPADVTAVIKEALIDFDSKIKGFGSSDGILTGVETRTSAPVRIERDENCESVSIKGVFPAGEGAGYAGGIVSAAVDGMRVAEELMRRYAPLSK